MLSILISLKLVIPHIPKNKKNQNNRFKSNSLFGAKMKNLAILLLFVTLVTALEIEPNGKSIEKKQEKRGISSLGYAYGTPGLGGYDSGFGGYAGLTNGAYGTPISYNRIQYTTGGGYNGGYGGYSGLSPYSGYSGVGGYNSGYNGGYNSAYNGGYRSGYSGIYNRGGLGYSGLGSGYSTLGSGYNSLGSVYNSLGSGYNSLGSGYNSFGSGYSGLGYSSDGYSSVYPYSRVAGLAGSSPYTGYAANGGYVY